MRILQWSAVPTSESRPPPRLDKREVRPNGVIWVAVGATLWGSDAVLRRPLTGGLSSAEIVFFEHVILAVILLPVAIRIWRRGASFTKAQWAALLWIGWGGSALATIFFTQAIKLGNPTTAVFLQKLQPLFAVLAARVWLREGEAALGRFWVRLAVALAAALLISGALDSGFAPGPWKTGSLWAVAAAFIWGTSTVAGRSMFPAVSPLEMTALRVLAALPLLAVLILAGSPEVSLPLPAAGQIPTLLLLAIVPGLLGLLFYYRGLSGTSASRATLAELCFPAGATLLNWAFLGTTVTAAQLVGVALLWGAVLWRRSSD